MESAALSQPIGISAEKYYNTVAEHRSLLEAIFACSLYDERVYKELEGKKKTTYDEVTGRCLDIGRGELGQEKHAVDWAQQYNEQEPNGLPRRVFNKLSIIVPSCFNVSYCSLSVRINTNYKYYYITNLKGNTEDRVVS